MNVLANGGIAEEKRPGRVSNAEMRRTNAGHSVAIFAGGQSGQSGMDFPGRKFPRTTLGVAHTVFGGD